MLGLKACYQSQRLIILSTRSEVCVWGGGRWEASLRAQRIKAPAANPDNFSSSPRPHMLEEMTHAVFSDLTHTKTVAYIYHTTNRLIQSCIKPDDNMLKAQESTSDEAEQG